MFKCTKNKTQMNKLIRQHPSKGEEHMNMNEIILYCPLKGKFSCNSSKVTANKSIGFTQVRNYTNLRINNNIYIKVKINGFKQF